MNEGEVQVQEASHQDKEDAQLSSIRQESGGGRANRGLHMRRQLPCGPPNGVTLLGGANRGM